MCELCEKYGDNGGRWYLNPENYARPLYKKVEKEKERKRQQDRWKKAEVVFNEQKDKEERKDAVSQIAQATEKRAQDAAKVEENDGPLIVSSSMYKG